MSMGEAGFQDGMLALSLAPPTARPDDRVSVDVLSRGNKVMGGGPVLFLEEMHAEEWRPCYFLGAGRSGAEEPWVEPFPKASNLVIPGIAVPCPVEIVVPAVPAGRYRVAWRMIVPAKRGGVEWEGSVYGELEIT